MKDIDFDELDRAVSSVLEPATSKTPASDPAAVTSEPAVDEAEKKTPEVTVEAEVTPPAVAEPVASAEVESPVATPPAAKTPLAIKRRGQFMDVVHPSSDMTSKPEDGAAMPAARKVAIKPLSASVVPAQEPESTTPSVEEASVAETIPPSDSPTETVESSSADRAMPDPLDVMQDQEETKDASSIEASTVEDTPVDVSSDAVSDEEATPTTPFLTDTKVDKRPLDAFSGEEAPVDPAAGAAVVASEPLPPELQADVIAVESNPSERVDDEKEAQDDDSKKEEADSGFNASIPQQYTSTEGKSDDDHSIFDTREYHQPLSPAKTKKRGLPGWLVTVLVIFLLAGLGAAGGYFWFYYGL